MLCFGVIFCFAALPFQFVSEQQGLDLSTEVEIETCISFAVWLVNVVLLLVCGFGALYINTIP